MTTHHPDKTIHQFVKRLTIRHPITFGKKVMDKIVTGPEATFPDLEVNGHVTNMVRDHLEKTILVLLRFLLAGDKHTSIEDDAITALRGIVSDEIIDARHRTVSEIVALDKSSIDAAHRLTGAREGYWPRCRVPLALYPVLVKIIGWLYEQITQDANNTPVYLPTLTEETQDLKNIFVTKNTVWAVDIWAVRLRSYSPRQAMCILSLLNDPVSTYPISFTPAITTPFPVAQIGVFCPRQLTRYIYPNDRIGQGLVKRWAETFDRFQIGLDIY